MSVAIFLVRFFCLRVTLKTCLAGIVIKLPEPEDAHGLIESTVRTLKSCHKNPENGLGVVGDAPNFLVSSLMSEPYIPIVSIDGTSRRADNAPVPSSKPHKLPFFLVTVSSRSILREHLADVRKSRWWNHMADFWVVEWPTLENDCASAYEYLWSAWRMNILEAKFVCVHGTRGTLMYGFNPYTRHAPDPWRLENVHIGDNGHAWSLLSRGLSNFSEPCRNMSFDKTKDLGGYEIRVTAQPFEYCQLLPNKTGIDALAGSVVTIFKTILRTLNATVHLLVHGAGEPLGPFDAAGKPHGVHADVYTDASDVALRGINTLDVSNLTRLRPYYYTDVSVITRYRESASQLEKIISLIDVKSRVGLLLVCLLTFVFFKHFLRQTSSIASLNVLRLICNSCLVRPPSLMSARIYLGSLLFFVVTLQGIYQGQLASLLAKSVPARSIDNIEDLRKSDHTIYGHHLYEAFFSLPELQGRFIGSKSYHCIKQVLWNSSNACATPRPTALLDERWPKIHLSKDDIGKHGFAYPIRRDWPLEEKLNRKIQALFEADVFRHAIEEGLEKKVRTTESIDNEDRGRRFKVLSVSDLGFAFGILAFGLTIAAVTFVVEVIRG